jgi:dethiobiotin synthetase
LKSSPRIFITGIGTGIGKTLVAAILAEALEADYWKPVQAGFKDGTDSDWVRSVLSNNKSTIHSEAYRLRMAASPHIAARAESCTISLEHIRKSLPLTENILVIEGAGGLMVPLNDYDFVADLAVILQSKLILVSRNYLGSINHSLLTSEACKQRGLDVIGWIFNDNYLNYEEEIVNWSGFRHLGSIPYEEYPGKDFIKRQANLIRPKLEQWL